MLLIFNICVARGILIRGVIESKRLSLKDTQLLPTGYLLNELHVTCPYLLNNLKPS